MFNVGGGEILVILLLALLVLGPDKLPEYARKAGRYMNEFRRLTSGFQEEFRQAMDLSDTDSSTPPAPAATGDALDRTTEGPRLVAQPEPSAATPAPAQPAAADPAPEAPAVTPAPVAPPVPAAPPAPAYGGAFAADVTPAGGPAPEVAGPAGSDHDGGTGSPSAA
jgi:sec-independent protein translocase protein TatB